MKCMQYSRRDGSVISKLFIHNIPSANNKMFNEFYVQQQTNNSLHNFVVKCGREYVV